MKFTFELSEGQEFIIPILAKELGVEIVKVDETPKRDAPKYWRNGWHRRPRREKYPNKSFMVAGNYYRVFFDGPCEDAQLLKKTTGARWDSIHGYWYVRASLDVAKWLIENGYTVIEK